MGGALKPKFLKPRTEIPKQVRDDKKETQTLLSCWTRFSIWLRFFLPLADTPFIPVHRTGFSGVILIKEVLTMGQMNLFSGTFSTSLVSCWKSHSCQAAQKCSDASWALRNPVRGGARNPEEWGVLGCTPQRRLRAEVLQRAGDEGWGVASRRIRSDFLPRRRDGEVAGYRRRWAFFSSLLVSLVWCWKKK